MVVLVVAGVVGLVLVGAVVAVFAVLSDNGSSGGAAANSPTGGRTTGAPALVVPERPDEVGATSAWRNSIRAITEARWGDYWDMWDAKSQAAMSRAEFLALAGSCPSSEPNTLADQMTLTVEGTNAYLDIADMGRSGPIMAYENEHWRRVPILDELRDDPCLG